MKPPTIGDLLDALLDIIDLTLFVVLPLVLLVKTIFYLVAP